MEQGPAAGTAAGFTVTNLYPSMGNVCEYIPANGN
jgi:hypothetical protein